MSVLVLLIAAGGAVACGFLIAFAWAVRSGQYDDTASPPLRMLFDDSPRASVECAAAVEAVESVATVASESEGALHVHTRR